MKTKLTDQELWQCLSEAEECKANKTFPLDVRIQSMETYAICLQEADNRGYDYAALKAVSEIEKLLDADNNNPDI
jgi:hypothetical protein